MLAVRSPSVSHFSPLVLILHPLGAFEAYGKCNYDFMKNEVEKVRAFWDDAGDPGAGLRKPYDDKVGAFPCRSFNIGGQVATAPHLDDKNLAHSWCAVTALGRFNPDLGGHLVLWDFGLAVRFPPGSTILLPSALLVHSNATIQPGETRSSIVQYAAGGLFRWAKRGFITEKKWAERATREDRQGQVSHWAEAVGMFTKLEELMPVGRGLQQL